MLQKMGFCFTAAIPTSVRETEIAPFGSRMNTAIPAT
jgi:hypothetical protein